MVQFTCEQCGTLFGLPESVLQRYPGWQPRQCRPCRDGATASAASGGAAVDRAPTAASRSGRRRAPRTITAELNLPVEEVLRRFTAGPRTGIFTDGACAGNPGPGGWGAVHVQDDRIVEERHGGEPATTNNRMELMGMIAGLEMASVDAGVDVYSDSQLVVNTLNSWAAGWELRGWRRKEGPVKNLELVQRAWEMKKARPAARIQWIKAHNGDRWNEYADALATAFQRTIV